MQNFLEKRYNEDMELDDAVHTALLTLREGFEGCVGPSIFVLSDWLSGMGSSSRVCRRECRRWSTRCLTVLLTASPGSSGL